MQTHVSGSKGLKQSVANRLQQKAATSGCSSPAPCYLARMQADHYHIFRMFSKEARNLVLSRPFPVCEYQWWLIECFQNNARSQGENGFPLCILYFHQQRLAEAAWASALSSPPQALSESQNKELCFIGCERLHTACFSSEHPSLHRSPPWRFYLDIDYVLAGSLILPIMLMNEKLLPNIPPA